MLFSLFLAFNECLTTYYLLTQRTFVPFALQSWEEFFNSTSRHLYISYLRRGNHCWT